MTMVMCYSIDGNGLYLLFTNVHIQYLGANCHICNKHVQQAETKQMRQHVYKISPSVDIWILKFPNMIKKI